MKQKKLLFQHEAQDADKERKVKHSYKSLARKKIATVPAKRDQVSLQKEYLSSGRDIKYCVDCNWYYCSVHSHRKLPSTSTVFVSTTGIVSQSVRRSERSKKKRPCPISVSTGGASKKRQEKIKKKQIHIILIYYYIYYHIVLIILFYFIIHY